MSDTQLLILSGLPVLLSIITDSTFLRTLSSELHANGLKMSECVGTYPTADGGVDVFYDPVVVAETNDVVRVMNYDM